MKYIKPAIVLLVFTISLIVIGKIFWEQELKYTRPTPVPEDYTPVAVHQVLDLNAQIFKKSEKPKHLHFFNPECPCSRFNLAHFSSLLRKYGHKIDFYIILPSGEHLKEVAEKFGNSVPVIADQEERIAKACGVYSTPQAVLIDASGKLYFKGNYNKARYCTSVSTSYAAIAIDSLLANKPAPEFGIMATTAYGCEMDKESWFHYLFFKNYDYGY